MVQRNKIIFHAKQYKPYRAREKDDPKQNNTV